MKRARKERQKSGKRASHEAARKTSGTGCYFQSRCAFHFQSQLLTLEISLVYRQTVFYKDCHWLSGGGRSNRFFTGVIQEDYERYSSDNDTIITNLFMAGRLRFIIRLIDAG